MRNRGVPVQRDELTSNPLPYTVNQPPLGQNNPQVPMQTPQPVRQSPHERPAAPPQKVAVFGRKKEIIQLRERTRMLEEQIQGVGSDNARLQQDIIRAMEELTRLGGMDIRQRNEEIARLDHEIELRGQKSQEEERQSQARICELSDSIASKRSEIGQLDSQILGLKDHLELNDMGLFDFDNPAEDSVKLKEQLASNKLRQKEMTRNKSAVRCTTNFTFNNSAAQGRRFLNDMSKMALSLFNAEAENAVKSVKAGNLDSSIARLSRCADRIARFGKFIDLRIDHTYFDLRVKELSLTAMHMQAVQAEKEAERERKAELREQKRAQKELEAEMARLRKEQEHYQIVLAKMRENGDESKASELEAKLADIDKSINDVDYRSANIRAGYVYVISDVGAFGERMVKIGMTRRLEPMDRVRELSDASVPFRFDVHALFFSKDAVSLETMLHHEFEDRRVNRVNARKEFYYCTPHEVLEKLKEKDVAVVEYKVEPDAEEFKISQAIALKSKASTVPEPVAA